MRPRHVVYKSRGGSGGGWTLDGAVAPRYRRALPQPHEEQQTGDKVTDRDAERAVCVEQATEQWCAVRRADCCCTSRTSRWILFLF